MAASGPPLAGKATDRRAIYCSTMLRYTDSAAGITPDQLAGFFDGWPNPPTPETHLRILTGSDAVILAIEDGRVVGFITAIADGALCASLPLLEVLPAHRGRGIGAELVRRMLARLSNYYAIDLACDPHLAPFYERLGFKPATAMLRRNFAARNGRP